MSTQSAVRFLDKVCRDESLNRKLAAADAKASVWAAVGREAGFDFTAEELRLVAEAALGQPVEGEAFVSDLMRPAGGELSESQLKQVAGGVGASVPQLELTPALASRLAAMGGMDKFIIGPGERGILK